jgi:hypothetical protein
MPSLLDGTLTLGSISQRLPCALCVLLSCSDRLVPHEVTALAGRVISTVAGGWRHTLALDEAGTLFAWGW